MIVESKHNAHFMTRHVMKNMFTANLHKFNIVNRGKHCCYLIAKHCQCQDLNTKATMLFPKMHLNRNDNFASQVKHPLWQQQNILKQIQTTIFKGTMGIYIPIDDVVSRDKQEFVILALLPRRVTR